MITIKTPQEIATLREGGKKLAHILQQVLAAAQVGVTTSALDQLAERLIIEAGGVPAFKHYRDRSSDPPFPSTICASVNSQLVHTPASEYKLKSGDILTVDIGMKYPAGKGGLYTDMAQTIPIGPIPTATQQLLTVTKKALDLGIAQARVGNTVADISKAVQTHVEAHGFSVVRQLVGHGVGHAVHEDPRVPNFFDSRYPRVPLKEGMVIAIEPMVNVGDYLVETLADGWTIVPVDNSLSAHFEHTVAITKNGPLIITDL